MDHVQALRKNYPIYDLELVDVVCALKVMETLPIWWDILMCSRTTRSLKYEFSQKELNER